MKWQGFDKRETKTVASTVDRDWFCCARVCNNFRLLPCPGTEIEWASLVFSSRTGDRRPELQLSIPGSRQRSCQQCGTLECVGLRLCRAGRRPCDQKNLSSSSARKELVVALHTQLVGGIRSVRQIGQINGANLPPYDNRLTGPPVRQTQIIAWLYSVPIAASASP